MSDIQLANRFQNGDEAAFNLIYQRFRAWVYKRAYQRLRCPQDAEEVCQDVFVRAWNHRAKYDAERGSLFAWFAWNARSVIGHAITKKIRAQAKRLDDLVFDDDDGRLPDHRDPNAKDPAEAVANSDMILRVEDALCQMDDRLMRLCFVLNYFEGYSLTDIARIVDSTVSIVENRIKNTTQHLRHTLTE